MLDIYVRTISLNLPRTNCILPATVLAGILWWTGGRCGLANGHAIPWELVDDGLDQLLFVFRGCYRALGRLLGLGALFVDRPNGLVYTV